MRVFLALGCNVGECKKNFDKAIEGLSDFCTLLRASSRHQTKAAYLHDQPDFLNMALEVSTNMPAKVFLDRLKHLEKSAGRDFTAQRYGPRTLDIDILYYGQEIIELEGLSIPHPLIAERLFVLRPLAEIAEDLSDPRTGMTIRKMLQHREEK